MLYGIRISQYLEIPHNTLLCYKTIIKSFDNHITGEIMKTNKNEQMCEINKMRPEEEHERSLLLREKSGTEFYNKYKSSLVDVPCPACGNKEGIQLYKKFGFDHKKCTNCSTFWCSPRPTEQLLSDYYTYSEATKYWTQFLIKTNNERKIIQYEPRVNHIINVLKAHTQPQQDATSTIAVDMGAGSGAFALALKKTGYFSDVIAVDFDEDCCKTCESYGLNTKQGSINVIDDESVCLISMNDMIEHLFDPKTFLMQCRTKLVSGGALSIACPNGEGFDYQIMKDMAVNLTPPEHLNYFNTQSLSLLLENTGYKVVSVETPGMLDVQIVKRALQQNKIDMEDNKYLKYLLLNKHESILSSLQDFIKTNNLSSHMVLVAVKA